jgi:hypothetical protein
LCAFFYRGSHFDGSHESFRVGDAVSCMCS